MTRTSCSGSKFETSERNRAAATFPAVLELIVQVDGNADEGHVAEGLGKVPELLAGEPDFLGVQAEVVGVGEHLLETSAPLR